eukprot:COSAG05_NODE_881_length_6789_cov_21.387743_12_plen_207_part_00
MLLAPAPLQQPQQIITTTTTATTTTQRVAMLWQAQEGDRGGRKAGRKETWAAPAYLCAELQLLPEARMLDRAKQAGEAFGLRHAKAQQGSAAPRIVATSTNRTSTSTSTTITAHTARRKGPSCRWQRCGTHQRLVAAAAKVQRDRHQQAPPKVLRRDRRGLRAPLRSSRAGASRLAGPRLDEPCHGTDVRFGQPCTLHAQPREEGL